MTNMRPLGIGHLVPAILVVMLGLLVPGPASSREEHGGKFFRAALQGFEEVPATSTRARGRFRLEISEDGTSMTYTLRYSDLEGQIRQAHIHFAQEGVNGGIVVFLCQTSFNPDPTGHVRFSSSQDHSVSAGTSSIHVKPIADRPSHSLLISELHTAPSGLMFHTRPCKRRVVVHQRV